MKKSINSLVWVELTEEGVKTHNEYYEKLAEKSNGVVNAQDYAIKPNSSKYTEYVLHQLMTIFGHVSYIVQFKDNMIHFNQPK